MGSIHINVDEFVCITPVFTNVSYTGTRYEFDLNWTSQGDYYHTFDPTTTITLYMDLYDDAGNFLQTYTVLTGQYFNMSHYLVNTLTYDPSVNNKNRVVFRLTLSSTDCVNNTAVVDFPSRSY